MKNKIRYKVSEPRMPDEWWFETHYIVTDVKTGCALVTEDKKLAQLVGRLLRNQPVRVRISICDFCGQSKKDKHKHEFHRIQDGGCGRIKEHCECNHNFSDNMTVVT